MPNIRNISAAKPQGVFFSDVQIEITTQCNRNKITSFTLWCKNQDKRFVYKVENYNIIKAWQKLEQQIITLNLK
jgi:hypothetical protein